jgi:hypothetical protein
VKPGQRITFTTECARLLATQEWPEIDIMPLKWGGFAFNDTITCLEADQIASIQERLTYPASWPMIQSMKATTSQILKVCQRDQVRSSTWSRCFGF